MPPLTVASLATISTSRPETRPMPVTMPAAGASSSYMSAGGERRELEERRARDRAADRCARGPAACPARDDAGGTSAPPPSRARARPLAQLGDELLHAVAVGLERRRRTGSTCVTRGRRIYQPQQSVLKPQAGQRQTACMRYISAPQRSQSILSSAGGGGRF